MKETKQEFSDLELVELSKTNIENFGALVERYQQRLFYYIRRISYFENEDIEDILQEVFIKVYRKLNSFDTSMKFSTWLYQIARNATIDAIRKKHARPQILRLEDDELITLLRSSVDMENETFIKDRLDKVREIIRNLPYKYKEAMLLKFIEEKSYDEIMDILKKPKGTVAALINRGRKMVIKEAKRQGLMRHENGQPALPS